MRPLRLAAARSGHVMFVLALVVIAVPAGAHHSFASFDRSKEVTMTGVVRDSGVKTRHGAYIWGVYVGPEWRGRGVGHGLLDACLDWARDHGVIIARLSAVTVNANAIRCYVRARFEAYGMEASAIRIGDRFYDELLMVKKLHDTAR